MKHISVVPISFLISGFYCTHTFVYIISAFIKKLVSYNFKLTAPSKEGNDHVTVIAVFSLNIWTFLERRVH